MPTNICQLISFGQFKSDKDGVCRCPVELPKQPALSDIVYGFFDAKFFQFKDS